MSDLWDCRRRQVRRWAIAAVLALTALAPAAASAQAFVPQQGDGAVAVLYQNQSVLLHSLDDGSRIDFGATRTQSLTVDLTYGLTNRLALNMSVPYIASRYSGSAAHTADRFGRDSVLDVGGYHGTFQDFRLDVRYNAIRRALVVTPFVTALAPTHNYDYFGHGAPGRRLAELQVGVYVGQRLNRLLPGAFVQARYGYGIPQEVTGVRVYRSLFEGELGYFVGQRLRIFGVAVGQISHGGVRFIEPQFWKDLSDEERIHHDRIARINALNVGAGAQLTLSSSLDLFGSVGHTESMTNGHVLKYVVTGGVSWSFHHGAQNTSAAGEQVALVKCLCQKGQ